MKDSSNTLRDEQIDISVVIVNYKVKEYIANLLNSLYKAKHQYSLEIFVVDNNSEDDSISFLRERYPDVHYIANKDNKGFGVANNQAIRKATGTYTLIINPDTLVSEDTLEVLTGHMESHPDCGAAGCKILNPDGTFAPESRRSVPTIWTSACKVLGLNYLFPESKLFGKYYLSWLHEDEASDVPVLSGSFMFWRTSLLKELGGFDERFFMYGEDIDLCYRVQQTDFHIDYVPETSIIHYKGESTKKGDLRYIRTFNKAMYQFFEKHYSTRYSFLFKVFIRLTIWLRTILSAISTYLGKSKAIVSDVLILNLSLTVGFILRYALQGVNIVNPEGVKYLWINVLLTVLYILSGSLLGLFREQHKSISRTLKALSLSYAGVVLITFFVRNLAYTRLGLAIAFTTGVIFFLVFRLLKVNRDKSGEYSSGRIRSSKVIIVGSGKIVSDIIAKIHSRPDWSYEIRGIVGNSDELPDDLQELCLGPVAQLQDLVRAYKIDQVFFALNSISYKQMLKEISGLQKEDIVFKLIPDSMDFILGKSKVEYMEAIPLVSVEFEYSKPLNRALKRCMDLCVAIPSFLLLLLFSWPSLFRKKEMIQLESISLYKGAEEHRWKNWLRLYGYVIEGKLSLVGSPLGRSKNNDNNPLKKGITGISQISENRIQSREDEESFELYYLQNYSVWMDIDILVKTIFNGPSPLRIISESESPEPGK